MDVGLVLALVLALAALGLSLFVMLRRAPAPSIIELAEFRTLHQDLKGMWTTNITNDLMPELIAVINAEYDKLSDSKKEKLKLDLGKAMDVTRSEMAGAKGMINQVTKAPAAIAATMAPTRPPAKGGRA